MNFERINLQESIGFLTYKASRLLSNQLSARLNQAGLDLSVEQWGVLLTIGKFDGLTQGRLCELINQEKTGVSRLLAALEKRGLVVREADEADRRVKHISVTPEGETLLEASIDVALENRRAAVEGIAPGDLEVCCRVLRQIIFAHGGCPGSECSEQCLES